MLDVPWTVQTHLLVTLSSWSLPFSLCDIYGLHAIILDAIIDLYDVSVWTLRDGI